MKTLHIIFLIAFSLDVNAQKDTSETPSNFLALEIDPAPFILGGYSFSAKFSPARANHFTIMGSVYSSRFPDKMMSRENYNKGLRDLKMETSYALFTDYFLRSNRTGFHFGPSVFLYSKSVGALNSAERISFKSAYPNVRVGYVYKPFKKLGFYLNPWLNFGKELVLGENKGNEGMDYSPESFSYILALHFGYRVDF